jgi:hypothetical protein
MDCKNTIYFYISTTKKKILSLEEIFFNAAFF